MRDIGKWVLIAVVAVAAWKFFDGNVGDAVGTAFSKIADWIGALADWLLETGIFSSIFN